MKLHIVHRTVYRYRQPLRRVVQTLRLTPRSSSRQTVLDWAVQGSGSLHPDEDAWGNVAHLHTVDHGARRLSAEAAGVVETAAAPDWIDPLGPAPDWYREASTLVGRWPAIIDLALTCLPPGDWAHPLEPVRGIGRLLRLAEGVRHRVRYRPGSTDVHTTAEAAWRAGEGVCQDQAQVFIAACRAAGLPARYVSGYFLSHAPGASDSTGALGQTTEDAPELASHAWAEVCIDVPQRRWLGVDVTHACLVDERHVIVAVGPDYAACPPVRGVRSGGGDEAMAVQLRITPL